MNYDNACTEYANAPIDFIKLHCQNMTMTD